jgi:glycine cleavage system H lipoate-binding protein
VPSVELLVIVGVIIVVSLLSTLAHFKITQIAASNLAGRIQELNEALGEAMQMVGSSVQTENPLMAIIAKALDNKMEAPLSAKIVEQDESGKFVKKIE